MGIRFLLFSLSPGLMLLLCNHLARHPHKIYPYSLRKFVGIENHYIDANPIILFQSLKFCTLKTEAIMQALIL